MKTYLFLIITIIAVWIASFKKPFWGICFFYLYHALKFNYMFPPLRVLRPLFVTPLIVFFSIVINKEKKIKFSPQIIFITLLFLWMCLSRIIHGYALWQGEEMDPFFKAVIFLILLTTLVDTKEEFKFLLWIMTISYAALAFQARYHGTFSAYYYNRNQFAFAVVGALAFPLSFLMIEKNNLKRIESAGYFLVMAWGIAGSNSRAGYLGLIFVLALSILMNFHKMKFLIFIFIPLVFLFSRISSVHLQRFTSISVDKDQGGTSGQRIALWSTALRMMKQNPIFGVGSGESGPLFPEYADHEDQLRVGGNIGYESIKIHNMTLQIGAEMGLVGLAFFFIIIGLAFRDIWQLIRLCKHDDDIRQAKFQIYGYGLGIAIGGLFTVGQFSNRGYNLQFYSLICLAYSLKEIILKEHWAKSKKEPLLEEPVIPEKWGVPFRTIVFALTTYISLRL